MTLVTNFGSVSTVNGGNVSFTVNDGQPLVAIFTAFALDDFGRGGPIIS